MLLWPTTRAIASSGTPGWVLRVFDEHRLPQQVTERHAEVARHIDRELDLVQLAFTALDLAQPILGAPHQGRESAWG